MMKRQTEDKRSKALSILGGASYAQAHLDEDHGYNDLIAINRAVDAIDTILNNFSEYDYIDKQLLSKWKEELKQAGSKDAYTVAIARSVYYIAKDICDIYNK